MTEPQPSPSPLLVIDRRWLAALALALPLVALLAPSEAAACRGRVQIITPAERALTERLEPAEILEREADGVLAPAPAGDGATPIREHEPRGRCRDSVDPVDDLPPRSVVEVSRTLPPDAPPNRDAARLLAIAGALLLGLDLGVAAYRRRLRLAALIGAAVILAVGSLIYLVALSPWPNWPLMIVPAAVAAAIATRAMVNGR